MRKVYLLLALISISMFACKKAENNGNIKPLPGFIVNGITDVTVERDSVNFLSLSVEMKKGEQEAVTLSATGLPTGVTVSFTPESGTPDFTTLVSFRTSTSSVAGTYPIKLVATGKSGSRSYDMNLIIKPISECALKTMGQYLADDICDNLGSMTYNTGVFNSGIQNRIFISNLGNTFSSSVFANLNCAEGTLNIPQQSFIGGNGTITGTGTFSSTQMDINYSFTVSGGIPVSCHVVMTKQ